MEMISNGTTLIEFARRTRNMDTHQCIWPIKLTKKHMCHPTLLKIRHLRASQLLSVTGGAGISTHVVTSVLNTADFCQSMDDL